MSGQVHLSLLILLKTGKRIQVNIFQACYHRCTLTIKSCLDNKVTAFILTGVTQTKHTLEGIRPMPRASRQRHAGLKQMIMEAKGMDPANMSGIY